MAKVSEEVQLVAEVGKQIIPITSRPLLIKQKLNPQRSSLEVVVVVVVAVVVAGVEVVVDGARCVKLIQTEKMEWSEQTSIIKTRKL